MKEELIQQIVRRTLSEPAFQALLQGDNSGSREEPKAVKPDGLVLLNYVPEFEQVLNALKLSYGADYTLSICPSDQAFEAKPTLPEGMSWITPQDALSKTTWQKIILPACSPNTLAKTALGIRDNPINEIIGRAIIQGIPTLLVTKYLGFTVRTPKAYYVLYEGYLQTVRSYGVQVCETLEKCPALLKCKRTSSFSQEPAATHVGQHNTSSPEVIHYEKKYLADKDAYGIAEETVVIVKKGTVISPLARDTLKSRCIELRQEKEVGRQ